MKDAHATPTPGGEKKAPAKAEPAKAPAAKATKK